MSIGQRYRLETQNKNQSEKNEEGHVEVLFIKIQRENGAQFECQKSKTASHWLLHLPQS